MAHNAIMDFSFKAMGRDILSDSTQEVTPVFPSCQCANREVTFQITCVTHVRMTCLFNIGIHFRSVLTGSDF